MKENNVLLKMIYGIEKNNVGKYLWNYVYYGLKILNI